MRLLSILTSAVAAVIVPGLTAPVPVSSPLEPRLDASVKIVGTTHCQPYGGGTLSLATPHQKRKAPLTVASGGIQKYTKSSGSTRKQVSFDVCDSDFMQWKNTNDKRYGILKVDGQDNKCVIAYHAPKGESKRWEWKGQHHTDPLPRALSAATEGTSVFRIDNCTFSDDSGQTLQYFEYDVATADIKFLGRRKSSYSASSGYRYALTSHGEVLGLRQGQDDSHFHLHSKQP